uniref:Ankyrin repeat protein n=1 Tax=Marseillevirus LCMAC101 TaxID=2506602 RepID=A0A481YRM3_9VIRU|nr:MAG: ankyrin repeat protein [Marseillevirus LCMAC101]
MDINFEICEAISAGNMQRLRELVEEHGISSELNLNPDQPVHPLHYAVEMQNFYAVNYLLDNGVSVESGRPIYLTPLEFSVTENNVKWEIVELLVLRGATLNPVIQGLELSGEVSQKFTEIWEKTKGYNIKRSK